MYWREGGREAEPGRTSGTEDGPEGLAGLGVVCFDVVPTYTAMQGFFPFGIH